LHKKRKTKRERISEKISLLGHLVFKVKKVKDFKILIRNAYDMGDNIAMTNNKWTEEMMSEWLKLMSLIEEKIDWFEVMLERRQAVKKEKESWVVMNSDSSADKMTCLSGEGGGGSAIQFAVQGGIWAEEFAQRGVKHGGEKLRAMDNDKSRKGAVTCPVICGGSSMAAAAERTSTSGGEYAGTSLGASPGRRVVCMVSRVEELSCIVLNFGLRNESTMMSMSEDTLLNKSDIGAVDVSMRSDMMDISVSESTKCDVDVIIMVPNIHQRCNEQRSVHHGGDMRGDHTISGVMLDFECRQSRSVLYAEHSTSTQHCSNTRHGGDMLDCVHHGGDVMKLMRGSGDTVVAQPESTVVLWRGSSDRVNARHGGDEVGSPDNSGYEVVTRHPMCSMGRVSELRKLELREDVRERMVLPVSNVSMSHGLVVADIVRAGLIRDGVDSESDPCGSTGWCDKMLTSEASLVNQSVSTAELLNVCAVGKSESSIALRPMTGGVLESSLESDMPEETQTSAEGARGIAGNSSLCVVTSGAAGDGLSCVIRRTEFGWEGAQQCYKLHVRGSDHVMISGFHVVLSQYRCFDKDNPGARRTRRRLVDSYYQHVRSV
jgi:hypothetical protein